MAKNDTKRSATTVTVACKLPMGLAVKLPDGSHLHLHGANSPWAVAGFGLTQGVSSDTWDFIKQEHAGAKWLVNGFVFAQSEHDSAVDQAKDEAERKAGFEPIDPNNLPKGVQNGGGNIGKEGRDPFAG